MQHKARRSLTSGHLWQVDIARLITFAAVIAVHSIAFTERPSNSVAAGAMMLLQFGREVFFTITGFVLVYSMKDRLLNLRRFWPRRICYVAVPYVAWSAIYYGYSVLGPAHASFSLATFGRDLLYGGAMYHLYFLLVTLQLYVVFPPLMAFVRRSAARAGRVVVVVGLVNSAWLAVLQWVPAPAGPAGWLWQHAYELLPTYTVYVLAGCYAAVHLDAIQRFVEAHRRKLLAGAGACAAGALVAYGAQLPTAAPRVAAAVLQPATVLSCAAALVVLYLVGCRWAAGAVAPQRGPAGPAAIERRRRGQAVVATLSDASFGVYLAHPLVLQLLVDHGFGNSGQSLPAAAATVVCLVAAIAGGTVLSLAARHTPLSLALTGRPWRAQTTSAGAGHAGATRAGAARAGDTPDRGPVLAPVRALVAAGVGTVAVSQEAPSSA